MYQLIFTNVSTNYNRNRNDLYGALHANDSGDEFSTYS